MSWKFPFKMMADRTLPKTMEMTVKGKKRHKPTRLVDALHEKDGVDKKEEDMLCSFIVHSY